MAEVFQGTPVLVSVRIDGPDGRMVQYHVAGRDVSFVAEAVKEALSALPDQSVEPEPKAKKARKPRRTKAEIGAAGKKYLAQQEEDRDNLSGATPQTTGRNSDVPSPHMKDKKEVWP